MSRLIWQATLAAALLVLAGCEKPVGIETTPPLPVPATPTETPAVPSTTPPTTSMPAPATPAEPAAAEAVPPADAQSQYLPPYPDRTELFIPPDRDPVAAATGSDQGEDRVQLKGFVDVDGPRVILAIDGEIAPLSEGGERHGVRVVSISPPKVVLESGSIKWTASIE